MSIRTRGNLTPIIFAITVIVATAFADNQPDAVESIDGGFGIAELTDTLDIVDSVDNFNEADIAGFMDLTDLIDEFSDRGSADFMDNVDLITDDTEIADTVVNQDDTILSTRDTIDTSFDLVGTILGFEAALSIGAVPLFELWQNSLPNTLSDLGLASNFGIDSVLFPGDNAFLRYRVTEPPSQFNFVIPFGISLRRADSSGNSLSLGLSLFHTSKRFQSEIYMDGVDAQNRRIDLYELFAYSSVSLEAAYRRVIPSTYFSIDGSRQTYLTLAAGISPLNVFTRYRELLNRAPDEDGRMKTIEAAVDSALEKLPSITANGTSLSWRVGVSTLRNNRLEIGLYYAGSYDFNFYSGDDRIAQSRISGVESEDGDKFLSFTTSRIEFKVTFLMPTRRAAADNNGNNVNGGSE
ncbi:MAG: hypothetical protein LBU70_09475 [Chitinispirillales bacterium]|jgi:hypothetical protein|nr:hypothetical protein [Chitinispirillales bacterium]